MKYSVNHGIKDRCIFCGVELHIDLLSQHYNMAGVSLVSCLGLYHVLPFSSDTYSVIYASVRCCFVTSLSRAKQSLAVTQGTGDIGQVSVSVYIIWLT